MTQLPSLIAPPERHVVLVAPEVHWNTGNAGRTCLAAGAALHLVQPLGFSLEDKQVRRAGLDYWHKVPLTIWENLEELLAARAPRLDELALLSKRGRLPLWELPRPSRLFLIFGSETRGLPVKLLERYYEQSYHIPITDAVRCLNLSTAVGISLYQSLPR